MLPFKNYLQIDRLFARTSNKIQIHSLKSSVRPCDMPSDLASSFVDHFDQCRIVLENAELGLENTIVRM